MNLDVAEGVPAVADQADRAALERVVGDAQRLAAVDPDVHRRALRLDADLVPAIGFAGHAGHIRRLEAPQVAVAVDLDHVCPEVLRPQLLAAPGKIDHVEVLGVGRAEDQARPAGAGLAVVAVELELGGQVGEARRRVERPAVQVPFVGRIDHAVGLGPRAPCRRGSATGRRRRA